MTICYSRYRYGVPGSDSIRGMAEQQVNRRGEAAGYRTVCPHGQPPAHCQGKLLSFRVVRKRTRRPARTR